MLRPAETALLKVNLKIRNEKADENDIFSLVQYCEMDVHTHPFLVCLVLSFSIMHRITYGDIILHVINLREI